MARGRSKLVAVWTLGVGLFGLVGGASALPFQGFSKDDSRTLQGKDTVCKTPTESEAAPECERASSPAAVTRWRFSKPQPSKILQARVQGDAIELLGPGGKLLQRRATSKDTQVVAVYVSKSGVFAAVETRVGADGPRETWVVRLPTAVPPAPAFTKVLEHARDWEQSMVPCDRAGVSLRLSAAKKAARGTFRLTVSTRCGADRNRFEQAGAFRGDGADRLVFELPPAAGSEAGESAAQADAGERETFACKLESCDDAPGEPCLACQVGELGFTLLPVRR